MTLVRDSSMRGVDLQDKAIGLRHHAPAKCANLNQPMIGMT